MADMLPDDNRPPVAGTNVVAAPAQGPATQSSPGLLDTTSPPGQPQMSDIPDTTPAARTAPTNPAIAEAAHHMTFGRAVKNVLGSMMGTQYDYRVNPQTGETEQVPIKQTPGGFFRSVLAGALIGGMGGAKEPNFGRGVAAGGAAEISDLRKQDETRRQHAQEQFENQERAARNKREQESHEQQVTMNKAQMEHWNKEEILHERDANLRDREQLTREEEQSQQMGKWLVENGATPMRIDGNGQANNGAEMMKQFTEHPERFTAPEGYGRMVVKSYDTNGLNYDPKTHGWIDSGGNPVDLASRTTWNVYQVPMKSTDQPMTVTGKDLEKYTGISMGGDPNKKYTMTFGQMISLAHDHRQQQRQEWQERTKMRHDELMAGYDAAKVNLQSVRDQMREIQNDFSMNPDDKKQRVAELQKQADDATNRMNSLADQMNPGYRKQATGGAPAAAASPSGSRAPDPVTEIGNMMKESDIEPNSTDAYQFIQSQNNLNPQQKLDAARKYGAVVPLDEVSRLATSAHVSVATMKQQLQQQGLKVQQEGKLDAVAGTMVF